MLGGGAHGLPLQVVASRSACTGTLFRSPGPVEVNFNSRHSRQTLTDGVIDEWKKRLNLLLGIDDLDNEWKITRQTQDLRLV